MYLRCNIKQCAKCNIQRPAGWLECGEFHEPVCKLSGSFVFGADCVACVFVCVFDDFEFLLSRNVSL